MKSVIVTHLMVKKNARRNDFRIIVRLTHQVDRAQMQISISIFHRARLLDFLSDLLSLRLLGEKEITIISLFDILLGHCAKELQ